MTAARSPILVIEADLDLGRGIVEQLIADSHLAKLVQTGRHAALFAERHPPSLVVIGELDAPHVPLGLLRQIRRSGPDARHWQADVPVMILSSSSHQADLLRAFEAGADDILARPPAYLELRARLLAILRRTSDRRAKNRPLRFRSLAIDTTSREVTIKGRPIYLRRLEYDLLAYLASDPRRVLRAEGLRHNCRGGQ